MGSTLNGIRNCDTMKRARAWLDAHDVPYRFRDYKIAGINSTTLDRWIEQVGWEKLLNRAGTTFRKLPDADKTDLDAAKARALMLAQPSMMKRPVLERDGAITVGFSPDRYAALFG